MEKDPAATSRRVTLADMKKCWFSMSLCLTEGHLVLLDSGETTLGQFLQSRNSFRMVHAHIDFFLDVFFQIKEGWAGGSLQSGVAAVGEELPGPHPDGLEPITPVPVEEVLASMRNALLPPDCWPDIEAIDDRATLAVFLKIYTTGMGEGGEEVDCGDEGSALPSGGDDSWIPNHAGDAGASFKGGPFPAAKGISP